MNAAHTRTKYVGLVIPALALLVAACDRENRHSPHVAVVVAPSPLVKTAIVPETVILSPLAGRGCPFASAFDLVIDHQGRNTLFIEQVTIRLWDGSSVGGSPVLMSSADLAARFGSAELPPRTIRRFGLQPRFGCERFHPRSLATELVLRDGSGMPQTVQLMTAIR
jgi:hypothetical protein